jgi:hypothetical protein
MPRAACRSAAGVRGRAAAYTKGRWADAKYHYRMGPTVAIWLTPESSTATREDLEVIARRLDPQARRASTFNVTSTDIIGGATQAGEPRPFGMALGTAGLDEADVWTAESLLGFRPDRAVHAFACVNASVDHRILGELALFLARHFNGLVDFGGTLGHVATPTGKLLTIAYADSTIAETFHVADAPFLQWWLRQSDFHMVK